MNMQLFTAAAAAKAQQQRLHLLHRDYESRGVLSLQKVGTSKYAGDARTEVLCCAYAVDKGPVKLWRPPEPIPENSSKPPVIPTGGFVLTTTRSNPRSSSSTSICVTAGRWSRSSVTFAPWRERWRMHCRPSSSTWQSARSAAPERHDRTSSDADDVQAA